MLSAVPECGAISVPSQVYFSSQLLFPHLKFLFALTKIVLSLTFWICWSQSTLTKIILLLFFMCFLFLGLCSE